MRRRPENRKSNLVEVEKVLTQFSTHPLRIAGTKEVLCDWLEVSFIAIFISPNGQAGLPLCR